MGFRDYMQEYCPPWLQGPNGQAWTRALGDVKDGMTQLLKERVAARFPIRPGAESLAPYAPTDALDALGREQQMPRAKGEDDPAYAERLSQAFDIWRYAGTAYGVLKALAAAGYETARIAIRNHRLYSLDANGDLVVEVLPPGSWSFEPEPQPFWSRFVLLFSHEWGLPPSWLGTPVETLGDREDLFDPIGTSASGPVLVKSGPLSSVTGGVQVRIVSPGGDYDGAQFEYSLDDGATWVGVIGTDDLPWEIEPNLNITSFGTGGFYSGGELYRWSYDLQPVVVPPPSVSAEMNGIREHVAKWKAAMAHFWGIAVITTGAAWDSPPGTWDDEAASGATWEGNNVVLYPPGVLYPP